MVDLVLDHVGLLALGLELALGAVLVAGADADAARALDLEPQAGQAQAALLERLALFGGPQQLGFTSTCTGPSGIR
jgi:hypothetical protein